MVVVNTVCCVYNDIMGISDYLDIESFCYVLSSGVRVGSFCFSIGIVGIVGGMRIDNMVDC